jgi:hypothetical protein
MSFVKEILLNLINILKLHNCKCIIYLKHKSNYLPGKQNLKSSRDFHLLRFREARRTCWGCGRCGREQTRSKSSEVAVGEDLHVEEEELKLKSKLNIS